MSIIFGTFDPVLFSSTALTLRHTSIDYPLLRIPQINTALLHGFLAPSCLNFIHCGFYPSSFGQIDSRKYLSTSKSRFTYNNLLSPYATNHNVHRPIQPQMATSVSWLLLTQLFSLIRYSFLIPSWWGWLSARETQVANSWGSPFALGIIRLRVNHHNLVVSIQ